MYLSCYRYARRFGTEIKNHGKEVDHRHLRSVLTCLAIN